MFDRMDYDITGGKLITFNSFLSDIQIDFVKKQVDRIIADDTIDKQSGVNDFSRQVSIAFGSLDYRYSDGKGGTVFHKAKEVPTWIDRMSRVVEEKLERENGYYNHVLINKFANNEGIGSHRDNEAIYRDFNGKIGAVAIVSIGQTREPHSFENARLEVEHNSLIEMSSGQILHKVGKSFKDRYSITFRHIPG
jgi:alkylated DNA repair dioxygenase AlkB